MHEQDGREEKTPRRKISPIRVWVTPPEKKLIAELAQECGLSQSAYVRNVAMGYRPSSQVDLDQMDELFRLHADLGRTGGLLKMLLGDDSLMRDVDAKGLRPSINGLLGDLEKIKNEIKSTIRRVTGKRDDRDK